MRKLALAVGFVLVASGTQAASYLDISGTVHDPIQTTLGGNHPYSGPNLAPFLNLERANLTGAYLYNADLREAWMYQVDLGNANLGNANLSQAILGFVDLTGAILAGANVTGADLLGADLQGANLQGANLQGASLFSVNGLGNTIGIPTYNAATDLSFTWAADGVTPFDPVAAGWILVPEPNPALLLGIGLAGMAARRKADSPGAGSGVI